MAVTPYRGTHGGRYGRRWACGSQLSSGRVQSRRFECSRCVNRNLGLVDRPQSYSERDALSPPTSFHGPLTSIYQRALGSDFDRLHPMIQRRFGFSSSDGVASVGKGVMENVWKGLPYTLPFLYLGTWRRIMFPETGSNIPFKIENYAFVDNFGRETVTWIRTFSSRRTRRFDAYMIYSEERKCIVDYLGSHEHLAVDLDLEVDSRGGLRLRSGSQRFYEGPIAFRFPMLFSGIAEVREWYDDDMKCFRIHVDVRNRVWGKLFGYSGTFNVEWKRLESGNTPAHVLPIRQERRE